AAGDWLIDGHSFVAKVHASADGRDLELANGLMRRVIRLEPAAATIAFDNLMTSAALLRSTRREAVIELSGRKFDVGGLVGQPIHNYLNPKWLDGMAPDPNSFHFSGYYVGRTQSGFRRICPGRRRGRPQH